MKTSKFKPTTSAKNAKAHDIMIGGFLGAGQTNLLRARLGLVTPTRDNVTVLREDVRSLRGAAGGCLEPGEGTLRMGDRRRLDRTCLLIAPLG